MTHTPGPWKADGDLIVNSDGRHIATIAVRANRLRSAKANATLIAASPDLLAALKALRHEYLRMLVDYSSHVRGDPEVQALADDAIAKAERD